MSDAATNALMARFGSAFMKGDVEAIVACVTDDFEWRQAVGPDAPWGRVVQGKDELRQALAERDITMAKLKFSDTKVTINGNQVVGTFRISGETQDGQPADWRGCDLYEIRDGKIAYKDSYWKQIRR
jgi:ketosteroid isomerase-like protein